MPLKNTCMKFCHLLLLAVLTCIILLHQLSHPCHIIMWMDTTYTCKLHPLWHFPTGFQLAVHRWVSLVLSPSDEGVEGHGCFRVRGLWPYIIDVHRTSPAAQSWFWACRNLVYKNVNKEKTHFFSMFLLILTHLFCLEFEVLDGI